MALQPRHQLVCDHPHASFGVVDAAGMAIGEHHARIDHRRAIGGHHAPAEALHVNEAQQVWILDVGAGHRSHIHRQPAGQAQAGQGRLEEHLGQVGRILEREQRHRIEAVEHLPTGVVKSPDALGLMGEAGGEVGDEGFVVAVDGHGEAAGQVVFELGRIGDGGAVLAHISQGAGEQVGVALLAEAEDHRGAYIEGVARAPEAAARSPWDQVALQHQHLRPLGGQLAGGDQPTDAGADHDHIPSLRCLAGGGLGRARFAMQRFLVEICCAQGGAANRCSLGIGLASIG